jgi:hypothetical protein
MEYSFFLFTKLHDVILGKSSETYDIQYEELVSMYNAYDISKYNNPKFGEYECMLDYLISIKEDRLINLQ